MFRRAAVLVAVFVVCVAVVGLPLSDLGGHVPRDVGDPLLNVWALRWESSMLFEDPGAFYDGNTFWPMSTTLAYSDTMLPLVPVFAVLRALSGDDLVANAVLVLLLVLGAVAAAYALARRFVQTPGAALVAALSYGLGSFVLSHLLHVQLLTLGSFPLVFLLWFRALESRRATASVACGLAVAAASLASLYYAVVLAPCLAAMAVVHVATGRRWRDGRTLTSIGVVAAVAMLAMAPGLLPYRVMDERQGLARGIEPAFDLQPEDLLTPTPENLLYGGSGETGEHAMFPGYLVLGLAAVGLVAVRRSVTGRQRGELAQLGVAAAVAIVLALGAEAAGVTLPFRLLHDRLPGYGGIRATARFVVPALLLLGVVAGVGLDTIARRVRPRWSGAVVAVAVTVVVVELWAPVPWVRVNEQPAELDVYRALDELPDGPVVELPMASPFPYAEGPPLIWEQTEPTRMLHSLIDRNPRVNGYSGHHPFAYFETVYDLNLFPEARAVERLEQLDVRYVVLHTGTAPDGHQQYDSATAVAIVDDLPPGWEAREVGSSWLLTVPSER